MAVVVGWRVVVVGWQALAWQFDGGCWLGILGGCRLCDGGYWLLVLGLAVGVGFGCWMLVLGGGRSLVVVL